MSLPRSYIGPPAADIETRRHDYNHLRPHSSLGALTPSEFAALKREQTTPPQEGEITGGLYSFAIKRSQVSRQARP
jgi:hypothetical protein